MHYFIDETSKRSYASLKEEFPGHEVVWEYARIDSLLYTKNMTRTTTNPLNMTNYAQPVTAMFKQWGEPAHGITGWYKDDNLWVTYASTPHADISAYYHVQNVKTAWVKMCSTSGLVVPTVSPWEGHMQRCDYLQYEEGVNSFKLQYGYTTPGNYVKTLKVWCVRNAPGLVHQWKVSHVTGRERRNYAHLVGWSF